MRPSKLALRERHVPPRDAMDVLRTWSRARRLDWDLDVLWTGPPVAGSRPAVVRALLLADGVLVGEGTGKGLGEQARASAMFEALEDLATEGTMPPCRSDEEPGWIRHGTRYVPAMSLSLHLASRDAVITALRGLGAEPIGVVDMMPLADGFGTSRGRETELVPAALADLSYVPPGWGVERTACLYGSSNGIAAGLSPWDAILHAMNEVNERDAVGALLIDVMAQRRHGHSIEPSGHIRSLNRVLVDEFGAVVHLRRLRSVWGHVVLAVGTERDTRGCVIVGSGCSSDLAYAAQRALLELAQNLVVEGAGDPPDVDGALPTLDRLDRFPNLLRAARLEHLPEPVGTMSIGQALEPTAAGVKAEVMQHSAGLRRRGLPAYARPLLTTARDRTLAPHVWQVVIPGFERFHLVRAGFPIEPTGHLRTRAALDLARATTSKTGGRSSCDSQMLL
jgi:ribosomal protein S12 methylthiotransferase accessory factor YcaO